ncbi:MAG: phenylalanine--tRNA ligase subunit alpha [Nanoarchaeota archaeon]|jgi:phenylalanyl-tRNA synthetase alpha chain|nr:phenylalanine--tRNA ligase subunit alpha [Nanoarchaeota archaeon]|tara:strand:- start:14710 stop:16377 length:1668 start_codon:yes stop_codon:yes gene_type:complete
MVYRKQVKIKGQLYWYLFHTFRDKDKFIKKAKYIGRNLPSNINQIEKEFLKEVKFGKITKLMVSKEDKLVESLHPLERRVIPYLGLDVKDIVKKAELSEVEILRALQWLENKEVVTLKKESKEIIRLLKNGEEYKKRGLPETKFLKVLDKPRTMKWMMEKSGLDKDELHFSLGLLKKKGLIELGSEIKRLKKENFKDIEEFLKSLPKNFEDLNDKEKKIMEELKQRKEIIEVDLKKGVEVSVTPLGKELMKKNLDVNLIENLTPNLLAKGSWKSKKFRRYDVSLNVPKIYPGKRHFVNQAVDYAKRIWMDMGFEEMDGQIINTSFWNFDALFQPQDHPARDMQDSIFLDKKEEIKEKEMMKKVKEMHETGGKISKGWQYDWDEEKAKKLVMRTHTTVLSAQTLAKLKEKRGKFFAIGRNFRNEAVDWSHGFEFNQTEGIVVDPDANFRHLLGYLKEFIKKMGFPKARFRPAYFPYTEPSIEIDVFHPTRKTWIELGGAGIFRPEMVVPLLGENVPVLAWGLGLGRIIMDYYDIHDIRELYKNDIKQLREMKTWLR